MILAVFQRANQEAASLASSISGIVDTSKPFKFADYPMTEKRLALLLKKLRDDLNATIVKGIDASWELANDKNNALVRSVLGSKLEQITEERFKAYFNNNGDALEAFKARKDDGLGLSDRVWRYTDQYKDEIEMALDIGIGEGKSAAQMTKALKQYLVNPDALYRRVRNKYGQLVASKAMAAYHPGRGVYRSAYKNARRLSATENNIAYRTADYLRWQQLDFVVGISIQPSATNHPVADICDELAGLYPKDFKFTGWHPLCRCNATTVLKTEDELIRDVNADKDNGSVNYVADVPDRFRAWLKDNRARINKTAKLPYFLRDNGSRDAKGVYHLKELGKASKALVRNTPLDVAAKRHAERTPEQIQKIKDAVAARHHKQEIIRNAANNIARVGSEYKSVDISQLLTLIKEKNLDKMALETKNVAQQISAVRKIERSLADLFPNAHELQKSYAITDMQTVHGELSGVMNRWLAKYSYKSINDAPLEHLKNKLLFELQNPSASYSNSEILTKAIEAKIANIDRKIRWDNLIVRSKDLLAFKTRSTSYKALLSDIDKAIAKNDIDALEKAINSADTKRYEMLARRPNRDDIKTALNPEYKGGVMGQDLTAKFDAKNIVATDYFQNEPRFTNDAARLQGFDAPAKLVTKEEFNRLEQQCGEVFYRTVSSTVFRGVSMTGEEFASQLYKSDLLELNGRGGRVYGDGMYVATASWNGRTFRPLSDALKRDARAESALYGNIAPKTSEMTFTRKPKIIKDEELKRVWDGLSKAERARYGNHRNTYACLLGYDAIVCEGPNYMVIFNRSIIAVKNT